MVNVAESDNGAHDSLTFGRKKIAAKHSSAITSRPVWRWFVFAALAFIMFEWWVYHRKAYI